MYTTIEQTKEVSSELNKIPREDLKKKFDIKLMNELKIYPEIGHVDALDYLLIKFEQLKEFYNSAAKENQFVIIFFT